MTSGFQAFVASLPILVLLALMVGRRWPATNAMPVAWITAVALALFVWATPVAYVLAATVKGMTTAVEILTILFGALVLLFTLREGGALAAIQAGFTTVSEDRRIQAILVAWLLGAVVEGAAGFGSPAALLSPLLVTLGFPALAAVTVCLIANATPVSFGPVGVPTILGLGSTLRTVEVQRALAGAGMSFPQFVHQIGLWTAVLHSLMAVFVPLMAITLMTRVFGARRSAREGLRIWPYAIFAGMSFVIPYLLTAWLLGPEFPSLLGGLLGLSVVVPATRRGFLVPRDRWDFPDESEWEKSWSGTIGRGEPARTTMPLWKAWFPYAVAGVLLVASRVDLFPVRSLLTGLSVTLHDLFGTDVSVRWEPAYNPGIMPFLAVALLAVPFYSLQPRQAAKAWKEAGRRMKSPALTLLFTVPMVEVMQAGHSSHGWESMPMVIAHFASSCAGMAWPLAAPFVGAFGAFLAGSNTVSNMLFGLFQYSVADSLGISHILVLSLQNVGGSFGVLVCLFKIIAACAAVGVTGVEGLLLRRNFLPLLVYGAVVGFAGLILTYWIVPGLF